MSVETIFDSDEERDDWTDYDSGPFCRHWSDPSDCEEICKRCKHQCRQHAWGSCRVVGCNCEEFKE